MTLEEQRADMDNANEAITVHIGELIQKRDALNDEINALQTQRLENTKQFNRVLRAELERRQGKS